MIPSKRDEYLGQVYYNNQGLKMKIVECTDVHKVIVEFEDGYTKETLLTSLFRGSVKNPNHRGLNKQGYMGDGKYRCSVNKKRQLEYTKWKLMLQRCYNETFLDEHSTYKGCYVEEEWHNYQNFAEWYNKEYYDIGEELELDKDIMIKGNKKYSPEGCLLVPSRINTLIIKRDANRGKYPLGVTFIKEKNKYRAVVNKNNKREFIGHYDTPEEAFQAYKQAKEAYIQQVANEYKQKYGDKFPDKVYQALMNYRVEITD